MKAPTERFSDRVDDYVRSRPGYPRALVDTLVRECRLNADFVVADVGAGTGIFSRQLLDAGLRVIAVEPNREMREAAERALGDNANFTSVAGSAEATTLEDASVDLVVAAQAFHWFDYDATRAEFARIVRPGGHAALIWNQRDMRSAFQQGYERLLNEFAPEYRVVNHMNIPEARIRAFFRDGTHRSLIFGHAQSLDRDGLARRIRSSSYVPAEWPPGLADAAERLFAENESDGRIDFGYEARLHVGRMPRA